jgi:hypothetical protein
MTHCAFRSILNAKHSVKESNDEQLSEPPVRAVSRRSPTDARG